jgi:predicted lactoylglutathione lyase
MPQMIFVNLPVKDVAKSTAFYEAIGCTKDERFSNEMASAMQLSDRSCS